LWSSSSKSFLGYTKILLQLVQHAVALYRSVGASSFSDDISAHAARWMVGQDVESQKLICNVISEVYNVKKGFDDAKWEAVTDRWGKLAPALLLVWNTIDKAVVTTVKDSFQDRLMLWSTRMSEGPSIDDLFTPIKNSQWGEDVAVEAMAERSQEPAEADSDFVLLKRVGALCGPDQLSNIHLDKALAMFKLKAASMVQKIASTRRHAAPPRLTTKDKASEAIITQYESVVKDFESVVLIATDAVADLEMHRHNWMQAPHLIKLDLIVEVCLFKLKCSRHWSDVVAMGRGCSLDC